MKVKLPNIKHCITIACLIGLLNAQAETWIKDAANGCAIYNPNPQKHETIIWSGDIKDGKAHGYGTVVWKVREKVTEQAEGEWKDGCIHGSAVWSHTGGSKYEGQWKHGQKSGFGIYTWPNGAVFMGEYDQDQRKLGRIMNPDGKKEKMILMSHIRELSYKAQDAAIQARKVATKAHLRNKNRKPQISLSEEIKNIEMDQKSAETKAMEMLDTPVEDPSAK